MKTKTRLPEETKAAGTKKMIHRNKKADTRSEKMDNILNTYMLLTLCYVLSYTGINLLQASWCLKKDVDFTKHELLIPETPLTKEITVKLNAECIVYLCGYLHLRCDNNPFLFIESGKALHFTRMREILEEHDFLIKLGRM